MSADLEGLEDRCLVFRVVVDLTGSLPAEKVPGEAMTISAGDLGQARGLEISTDDASEVRFCVRAFFAFMDRNFSSSSEPERPLLPVEFLCLTVGLSY